MTARSARLHRQLGCPRAGSRESPAQMHRRALPDLGVVILRTQNPEDMKLMQELIKLLQERAKEAEIKISGDDKSGAIEINSPDGNLRFGAAAGNATPAWVPVYPGSAPQGSMSAKGARFIAMLTLRP